MAGPSFNKIILIGRLTRDPQKTITPNGTPVARFAVAVDRKTAEKRTDFIEIVVWRKLAETVTNILKKGRLVAIEGSLQIRDYETQTGIRRRIAEVIASNIQFLDFPKEVEVEEKSAEAPIDETTIDETSIQQLDEDEDVQFDESFIDLDKE